MRLQPQIGCFALVLGFRPRHSMSPPPQYYTCRHHTNRPTHTPPHKLCTGRISTPVLHGSASTITHMLPSNTPPQKFLCERGLTLVLNVSTSPTHSAGWHAVSINTAPEASLSRWWGFDPRIECLRLHNIMYAATIHGASKDCWWGFDGVPDFFLICTVNSELKDKWIGDKTHLHRTMGSTPDDFIDGFRAAYAQVHVTFPSGPGNGYVAILFFLFECSSRMFNFVPILIIFVNMQMYICRKRLSWLCCWEPRRDTYKIIHRMIMLLSSSESCYSVRNDLVELQCVAVCIAVCRSMLLCVAVCIAVCRSMLQCVAVAVLQRMK